MQILQHGSPRLRVYSEPFKFVDPPFEPIQFAHNLVKTMYDGNGICLTGIQVGVAYRVFALRASPENLVCYNPRIIMPSAEEIRMEETSMSYPGLLVKIKRPQHCKVRFAMPNGEIRTETFTGLTARYFQHCMDFLDGEFFYTKANPIHRQQAFKKWDKNG
jgi:peptide deformylase